MNARRITSFILALTLVLFFCAGVSQTAQAQSNGSPKQVQTVKQADVEKGFFERIIGSAVDSIAGAVAAIRNYVFGAPEQKALVEGNLQESSAVAKNEIAAAEIPKSECAEGEDCNQPALIDKTVSSAEVAGATLQEKLAPSQKNAVASLATVEVKQSEVAAGQTPAPSQNVISVVPQSPKDAAAKSAAQKNQPVQQNQNAAANVKSEVVKKDSFALSKVADEEKVEATELEEMALVKSAPAVVTSGGTQSRAQAQTIVSSSAVQSSPAASQPSAQTQSESATREALTAAQGATTIPAYVASGVTQTSTRTLSQETVAASRTPVQVTSVTSTTRTTTETPIEVTTRTTQITETTQTREVDEDGDSSSDRTAAQTIEISPTERNPEAEAPAQEPVCVNEFSKSVRGTIVNVKIVDNKYAVILSADGDFEIKSSVDLCSGTAISCRAGSEFAGCATEIARAEIVHADGINFAFALPDKIFFVYDGRVWMSQDSQKLIGRVTTESLLREGRVLISSEFYKVSRVAARTGDTLHAEECLSCRVDFALKDANAIDLSGLMRGTGFDRVLNPPLRYSTVQLANGAARGVVTLDANISATDPVSGLVVRIDHEFFVVYQ